MPKKILIVDDERDIRDLVEATLLRSDHVVFKADSGEKAIEIARSEKPHLILMDIMMPGTIDGLEATRILKRDPATRYCTIIILSAKAQISDREKGIEAGADGYFGKPFSPLELLRKVDQVLDSVE
ncbi:MAG TPA: response regulator [Desulfomonilaceae bacterium]|nr:response regulator [Desulfomonilaceae bacterium]